jgi:predicted aspartyl protease
MSKYSISFKILSTNHIVINAAVNNVDGIFLIDTGASNSCIDLNKSEKFKLNFGKSDEQASSATNEIKDTYISKKNSLLIGEYHINDFDIILFNMKHIIKSLLDKDEIEIDGIIGADILIKYDCSINYKKNELLIQL